MEEWEAWNFPTWCNSIMVKYILKKSWYKVFLKQEDLENYFTSKYCGMTTIGNDDELVFPNNFKISS